MPIKCYSPSFFQTKKVQRQKTAVSEMNFSMFRQRVFFASKYVKSRQWKQVCKVEIKKLNNSVLLPRFFLPSILRAPSPVWKERYSKSVFLRLRRLRMYNSRVLCRLNLYTHAIRLAYNKVVCPYTQPTITPSNQRVALIVWANHTFRNTAYWTAPDALRFSYFHNDQNRLLASGRSG